MKKTITVRGITIGEGMPKICVPLTGSTLSELLEETECLRSLDFDVAEWRADFFEHAEELEKVLAALKVLRSSLRDDIPLLFTFRSENEGGQKGISLENYVELNKAIIESGQVELIDVELFCGDEIVKQLVAIAHAKNVFVIVSNHDFTKTPSKEEIISRLCKAQELGGDLPKIAVMPKDAADVLTLLDASNTMIEKFADRPIITMSMAQKGMISRLAGEVFGSVLTFGAAKKASAPGQISATVLRDILALLHEKK
ncbi:type I 3-dehydroquinate dehydratase [Neobacillus sp. SM06]|uniref:type I 3-dehydroquinate dehydratase n=1 Tax=Neobacillus sp. SM06 TaxID=3422492 RepID=UPI003D2D43CE